jgi:hypothetical protein
VVENVLVEIFRVAAMSCRMIVVRHSGRKGERHLDPGRVRMEVRCAPKWSARLRGKFRGVLGEGQSLRVKPSQVGKEIWEGSKERRIESGNCTTPG